MVPVQIFPFRDAVGLKRKKLIRISRAFQFRGNDKKVPPKRGGTINRDLNASMILTIFSNIYECIFKVMFY